MLTFWPALFASWIVPLGRLLTNAWMSQTFGMRPVGRCLPDDGYTEIFTGAGAVPNSTLAVAAQPAP